MMLEKHGSEVTNPVNSRTSTPWDIGIPQSAVPDRSTPGSPESSNPLSNVVLADDNVSTNITSRMAIRERSDMTMDKVAAPQSDESGDSLSDITDYTEDSLIEAVCSDTL